MIRFRSIISRIVILHVIAVALTSVLMTQPAHALRGKDALLVSTFEFAGLVVYDSARDEPPLPAAK